MEAGKTMVKAAAAEAHHLRSFYTAVESAAEEAGKTTAEAATAEAATAEAHHLCPVYIAEAAEAAATVAELFFAITL